MRPIKFRAWDLESKIMWCHEELAAADPDSVMSFNGIIGGTSHGMVAMQFTGVLDKNGVEVYEGDVVRFLARSDFDHTWKQAKEMTGDVMWDAEDTGFFFATRTSWPHIKPWFTVRIEVIGNIHQHPELLNP